MRVSVVIPDLDSPLVDRAIGAVREQDLEPEISEIVVVGRDAPGLVAAAQAAPGTPLRFVETEARLSAGAARNLGVQAADGEALLFTDADCRPATSWARRLVAALERAPVAGGGVRFALSGNRWAVGDNIAAFHDLLTDRPAELNPARPLGSLNLALRRAAWERVGTFDPELATSEDHDWDFRARARGVDRWFEPAAVVEHAAVRADRAALERHARWYGEHFHRFRARHPGAFASGPSWRSRRRLAATAPLKAWLGAVAIFARHPSLRPAWRALPAVARFKRAWYRAVVESWPD